MPSHLKIVPYDTSRKNDFYAINEEWISQMFVMEPHDEVVLRNPQEHIIDKGGEILFVEHKDKGIIGTGALYPHDDGGLELTKMGVKPAAQGLKAGNFLLEALIHQALLRDNSPFFLVTNKKCAAAIHLYEKYGFVHSAEIMNRYASLYQRCDVAMIYARH